MVVVVDPGAWVRARKLEGIVDEALERRLLFGAVSRPERLEAGRTLAAEEVLQPAIRMQRVTFHVEE